jgi:hypothetical protein
MPGLIRIIRCAQNSFSGRAVLANGHCLDDRDSV